MSEIANIVNMIPYFNWIILGAAIFFAYNGFSIYLWILLGFIFSLQFEIHTTFVIWYAAIPAVIAFPILRRNILTKAIVFVIKKAGLLPKVSETEKTVLKSGNVWVDGELFSGNPNFKWIFSQKYPKLSQEEESFINNEVEELCRMCDDSEVYKEKDLSPKVWKYLKDKKFFGMIIPKEYGGLGFSAFGHSEVIQKLASRSVPLAITTMVPNSLGPAELLLHYGTKEQQDYYLPRLSEGKEIPCFALTEPTAGSDATAINASGVLSKDKKGKLKITLNWNKRYITLGAAATIIGLAFKMRDPENILGKGEDLGITCALIPYKTKGVRLGRRHDPLATPFINSPINGDNVAVDVDAVIGGESGIGKGWRMLMESLAAGRGISLPSTSTGGAKLVTRAITAYANIRQQFGLPIAKFEGVSEVLARIIAKTYQLEAMRSFTAGAVDLGLKPAVITAIAKYHSTELFREVINDGMDIAGGSGIIRGPRNLLANAYMSVPISITVEGANIVTRSLIHFGQGVVMCHPFIYKEMIALEKGDIKAFDKAFFTHFGHMFKNKVRAIILGLTRGYIFTPHTGGLIGKYERKLAWASANFAFLADLAVLLYGGNLKKKEKINGRFGDIL
ncbi:MAG: acyl-CoA dehydrogenase, partial [Proteobacteria bacterium]|nr:acyl-CoA dehydrogenase [Pseudomonadota bacterium]